jgi:hypothetical protein
MRPATVDALRRRLETVAVLPRLVKETRPPTDDAEGLGFESLLSLGQLDAVLLTDLIPLLLDCIGGG